MHRFYAEEACLPADGRVSLSPEDTRHALRVLRLKPEDPAEVFVGGARYAAILEEAAGERLTLRVTAPLPSTEPRLKCTLFQGLPKADKMEWIVQKAVELGVSRIVPVRMRRCVVRLEEKDEARKTERWQRIAREAGKQSGRCFPPEVLRPVSWKELPDLMADLEVCAVPWEEARESGPLAFLRDHPAPASLGILIGPEGGITPEEIASLPRVCVPVTLGPRILRTETAGLAATAAFLALYGEMEST